MNKKMPILTIEQETKMGFLLGNYDEKKYPLLTNHNGKTGAQFLVLNFPRITCAIDSPCWKSCYCNSGHLHTETCQKNAFRNLKSYLDNPKRFWRAILAQIEKEDFLFFRYFEMGDIDSLEFLNGMVWLAENCPKTKFVCYSKRYEVLLDYLDKGGKFPLNLRIFASEWVLESGKVWKQDLLAKLSAYGIKKAIYIPSVKALKAFDMKKGHICTCEGCSKCKACANIDKNVGFLDHKKAKSLQLAL